MPVISVTLDVSRNNFPSLNFFYFSLFNSHDFCYLMWFYLLSPVCVCVCVCVCFGLWFIVGRIFGHVAVLSQQLDLMAVVSAH
jgi:uncharacterized membrane protein